MKGDSPKYSMKEDQQKYEAYIEPIIELVAFAKRPSMYVGAEEMDLILAFIRGIELSTKFKLRFSDDLSNYIFEKYGDNREMQALKEHLNYHTLKEQISIICKSNDKTEVQNFSIEAIEFLVMISDQKLDGLFRSKLKSDLIMYLLQNSNSEDLPFSSSFRSSPEDTIYRFFKEWPGKGMPSDQFELLKSIKKINLVRNSKWHNHKEGDIDDKSELRLKSNELLELLSADDSW